MDLPRLIQRARSSAAARWLLQLALRRAIPFNRPHGFRVVPLPQGGILVEVPYRRANRNHIRGIHACCLATAAEFCSGLALMEHVDARRYRIIMKALAMEYHYQAKADARAVFAPSPQEVEEALLRPLRAGGSARYAAVVELHDVQGNHLATGRVAWQVKEWARVRTKP